jgi:fatty-acyl-CoA synthase
VEPWLATEPWDDARRFGDLPRLAAKALLAEGVRPGDHVALWLNNSEDWMFLLFAVAKVGAVLVPINTRFRSHDLEYVLRQSDSTMLITHDCSGPIDYLDKVRQVVSLPESCCDVSDPAFPVLRKVASFKIPRHVMFVDDFPMTASGKIRRVDLRTDAAERFVEA